MSIKLNISDYKNIVIEENSNGLYSLYCESKEDTKGGNSYIINGRIILEEGKNE